MPERLAYSPTEAAEALGVSRPTAYQLMHRTDFPSFKVGNRTLISANGLRRWVEAQATGGRDSAADQVVGIGV